MLRNGYESWWQRLVWRLRVPSYVLVRPAEQRRCPECAAPYEPTDRYCRRCHVRVPEWRF